MLVLVLFKEMILGLNKEMPDSFYKTNKFFGSLVKAFEIQEQRKEISERIIHGISNASCNTND